MHKHFDHGSILNGSQVGLYNPTFDCFLLTLPDVNLAQQIKLLSSSRYGLFVCNLTVAKNFQDNLMDNECCENWTIADKSQVEIGSSYQSDDIISVDTLLPTKSVIETVKEKHWLLMQWHWLKFLEYLNLFWDWKSADNFVQEVLGINDLGGQFNIIKDFDSACRKEMYLGKDIISTENNIHQLIKSQPVIEEKYKVWLNK